MSRHSKYHITGEGFINPYNFVSINECVERELPTTGELSGKIVCTLKTLTPLFIPNTTNPKAFDNSTEEAFIGSKVLPAQSYDFFSYEDLAKRNDYLLNPARPIIPGSSIRGAIRSAFEAATNGCLSTSDDETVLYQRTPEAKKRYGIVQKENGKWWLVDADKVMINIMEYKTHPFGEKYPKHKVPFGSAIYIKKTTDTYKTSPKKGKRYDTGLVGVADIKSTLQEGYVEGYYLRGEMFNNKHHDAVMVPRDDAEKMELSSVDMERIYNVWQLYQSRDGAIKGVNISKGHSGYKGWIELDNMPIYYDYVGDKRYISPACVTKDVFDNTIKSILAMQGEHQPCDGTNLCLACRLFGMVSASESRASRLMFKDATPIADGDWATLYDNVRTLPILSSPKVSATEFYMENVKGVDYFNYDYAINNNNSPKAKLIDKPKLRGRKFYWHKKEVHTVEETDFANQRTRIRPLAKEKEFTFEIAFDRLHQSELETLLWVLTFGDNNSTHAHKLGFGKPYGYGSMRISEAEVFLVTLNDDLTLKESKADFKPQLLELNDSVALKEFLAMTDFVNAKEGVEYPYAEKEPKVDRQGKRRQDKGAYVWFGINKEVADGAAFNKPKYHDVLPKPLDKGEKAYLPKYSYGAGEIGTSNRAATSHDSEGANNWNNYVTSRSSTGNNPFAAAFKKAEEKNKNKPKQRKES